MDDKYGRNPLHHYCLGDKFDEPTAIVKKNLNVINEKDFFGNTALHYASYHNILDLVRSLIEYGGEINAISNTSETPLSMACSSGHFEVVNMLLSHNVDINIKCEAGWSILHIAAEKYHHDSARIIEALIKAGANPNWLTYDELKPSQTTESSKLKDLLLRYEKKINQKDLVSNDLSSANLNEQISLDDENGHSPLYRSVLNDNVDEIKEILKQFPEKDIILNKQDYFGNTILHYACYHNCINALNLLLEYSEIKVSFHLRTKNGDSPLDYACTHGHITPVRKLLTLGALVNVADNRGWTALHNACSIKHSTTFDIIDMLMDHGADLTARTSAGQTCYDVASDARIQEHLVEKAAVLEQRSQQKLSLCSEDDNDNFF